MFQLRNFLKEFDQAKSLLLNAKSILIISHKNPDADAVGANLALREALENIGKKVDSACVDPVPKNCFFLRKSDSYIQEINPLQYDLLISVDCGGHKQLGFHEKHPEILDGSRVNLINIDHHLGNDKFGTVNLVMDQTPSTCFILYLLFNYCGWEISKNMASALMHGLYFDTGSFMHPNTDSDTLRIAGRLKALGADHEKTVKMLFHDNRVEQLRLWGRALSKLRINKKGALTTAINKIDYQATRTNFEDLSGLVAYLNQVPEAKFTLLLSEDTEGSIKASLRTQNPDINLSAVAGLFGGGGHKQASGFNIKGRLEEITNWQIV